MYARAPKAELQAAGGTLPVTVATLSDSGGRSVNEDALGFRVTASGSCFVVSDGAGGHSGGGFASRLIVDQVLSVYLASPRFEIATLVGCFESAESALRRARRDNTAYSDMSGTAAVLMIDADGSRALWGHLGDTRITHFRRGAQLSTTRDHSVVQRLIDAGLATSALALRGRNLLYGAIGGDSATPPAISPQPVPVEDGDAFLLSTDGFWGVVDEAATRKSLRLAGTVDDWIGDLHRRVISTGGDGDNFTALAVWVGAPEQITVIEA